MLHCSEKRNTEERRKQREKGWKLLGWSKSPFEFFPKMIPSIYFWSTFNKRALALVLTCSLEMGSRVVLNIQQHASCSQYLTAVPLPFIFWLLSDFHKAHQYHPAMVFAANQFSDVPGDGGMGGGSHGSLKAKHVTTMDVQSLEVLCSRILR